ncbi:MAG: hypothetical protein JRN68_04335 [Nitrososphaerota archaeon]|nr:hypothetical protein [Nitrososphaerota archaeon]
MKRFRRYLAVITSQRGKEATAAVEKTVFNIWGGAGMVDIQLFLLQEEDWGLILRLRAANGRSGRLLPFALSLVGQNGSYMQCVATSGSVKGLRARLKEMGLSTKRGMK